MVIKISIGIAIYALIVVLFCLFFKGASQLANEYEEKMEAKRLLKKLKEDGTIDW